MELLTTTSTTELCFYKWVIVPIHVHNHKSDNHSDSTDAEYCWQANIVNTDWVLFESFGWLHNEYAKLI